MINNFLQKIKQFLKSETANNLYIVLIIILVAFGSFGLGRLSKVEEKKESISIEYPSDLPAQTELQKTSLSATQTTTNGYSVDQTQQSALTGKKAFVASKNGSKYHFPWCPGAKQMKEENKIWFSTREEAESAGYSKAANCKGL